MQWKPRVSLRDRKSEETWAKSDISRKLYEISPCEHNESKPTHRAMGLFDRTLVGFYVRSRFSENGHDKVDSIYSSVGLYTDMYF